MASSTKSAGTGANLTGIGTSAWTNPDRIVSANNSYAICTTTTTTGTNYLRASNFGFTIPSGANILGIVVNIKRYCGALNYVQDLEVKLVNASGVVTGNNKASASLWGVTNIVVSYGSSSDLWGLTLTDTDINDVDFGCVIAVKNTKAGNVYANVDHMEMTVYYATVTTLACSIINSATISAALSRMVGFITNLSQNATLTATLITSVNFEAAITQISSLASNLQAVAQFAASIIQSATLTAGGKIEVRVSSAIEQLSTITAHLRIPALLSAAIQQLATFVPRGSSSWTSVTPPSNSWDENADESNSWIDISDSTNWTEL